MNHALLFAAAAIEALQTRISFANVIRAFEADAACVTFDVLVDSKLVGQDIGRGIEWTDEDGDIVREDCHNDVNRELIDAVHEALGDVDDRSATYVAFFALLQRAVEAITPSDPEGDERDLHSCIRDAYLAALYAQRDDALIDAMAAAEAEADIADEQLRLEYSNALVRLDEISVAGSKTADVQKAFDELTDAALNNPFGQDVIREAKEVLEGTQWQLVDGNTIVTIACPDDYTDDAPIALDVLVKDYQGDGFGFEDRGPGAGRPEGGTLSDYEQDAAEAYGAVELRQLRKKHVTADGHPVLFASEWTPEYDAQGYRTGNEFRLYF